MVLVKNLAENPGVYVGSQSRRRKEQRRKEKESCNKNGKGQDQHGHTGGKMAHSHDQSIAYSMLYGVVKIGQKRIYINICKKKGHKHSHKNSEKEYGQGMMEASSVIKGKIHKQEYSSGQRHAPNQRGLPEVFFKGPEERGGQISFLVPHIF